MIEEYNDSATLPLNWKMVTLSEITKVYDGTHQTPTYLPNGIPFYSVEHVTSNNFSNTKFISEEVFKKENQRVKLDKGDILMTRIGDVGTVKYIDWDVNASFYVSLALIKQQSTFDGEYLTQFMKSNAFQNELWKRIIHTAFPKKINLGEIGKCNVILPPISEQQKIAIILSTVDDKIEVIDQQIIETQALKKGLMQRLLTKGIGHTKFKDSPLGMIPESWEVLKCDSVADITSSKRVYLSDYTDCGIPFFRGKEITQLAKGEKLNDLVYIKEDTFIEFKNRFGAPKEGDILITAVGTIGSIYMVNSADNFYFKDGNLMWLREIDSRLNGQFITHYFRSIIFQNLIDVISSGSSQKALTIVKFKLLPVVIPPLDEQIKISKILDSVYEKVSVLEVKKTHYQELKQGLMQQLLTGKIRVKI
ncbi:restriction endonuclease subunit S [Flavobacterium sp. FlaQc-51]|uniref:restriction endonuclease subunit S n=1 Tax=Flavobacterium sp. FlaQc-51 TaxID=3374184 RepID=UPI00375678A1